MWLKQVVSNACRHWGDLKPLETRNPDFEKRIRESFLVSRLWRRSAPRFLGSSRAGSISPLHLPVISPQQHEFIHGGVVGAIADNAAVYAAYSLMNADDSVLTVEYKLTLLAPGEKGRVEVRAEVAARTDADGRSIRRICIR